MRCVKDIKLITQGETKHTALIDCELLAKVYINLIDQKEPTLDFHDQELTHSQLNSEKFEYYKKIIKPTKEELESHNAFLKSQIKKNFFN